MVVACGQQVEASFTSSPKQVCALKACLLKVPGTRAKLQSCGAVNTVVRGPRIFRVLLVVLSSVADVGVAIAAACDGSDRLLDRTEF